MADYPGVRGIGQVDGLEGALAAKVALHRQSIVMMGDSITAQNGTPGGTTSNGTTFLHNAMGWWHWANARLGQRFQWLGNYAVGGSTTTQQLAQLPSVLSSDADYVLWLGGANDLAVIPLESMNTINALAAGYAQIRAAGKVLIACTFYRSSTQTSAEQAAAQAKINAFIRKYCRENPDVILWDVAPLMTVPLTSTARTDYCMLEVGGSYVHPNHAGAQAMGASLAALLAPITRPLSPLIATNDDPFNLISNGLFHGSVPSGWGSSNGSGAAPPGVVSRVNRTDGGIGGLYQAALAGTGSDSGKINLFASNTNVTSATHGGHVIIPRCYFEADAASWNNIKQVRIWAQYLGASGMSVAIQADGALGSLSSALFPSSCVLQGPPITVPSSGVTRVQFFAEIESANTAAASAGTIRIGQAEVHDLTACGY